MTIASGTCGENLTWELSDNYYLIIYGFGDMDSYSGTTPPWNAWKTDIIAIGVSEGVTSIGNSAFMNHTHVATISLPPSLQNIYNNAFYWCSALTSIIIPAAVGYIGSNVFTGCTSLWNITVTSENTRYMSSEGVLYRKLSGNVDTLIKYPPKKRGESYSILSGTKTIDSYAIERTSYLKYVVIPSSMRTVSANAFSSCLTISTLIFEYDRVPSSMYSSSFGIGGITTPVTCKVRSPNNALNGALDAYKNQYTTFEYINMDVTVSLYADPSSMGTVSGAGTYTVCDVVTLEARPYAYHHLVSWSDGSTAQDYPYQLWDDLTLTATFAIDTYTITIIPSPGGTVTGGGTYDHGTYITLTAIPDRYFYKFLGWSDGNTDNPRTLRVMGDLTLSARFWTYDGELLLSYDEGGTTYALECGTVVSVGDNVKASVLVTPIVTYTANNAFAFDTGATENLTFNITRRNPPETDDESTTVIDIPTVVDYHTLPTGPWENTHRWCNRMWKIALERFIDRWQMRTDGCKVRFVPYVKKNGEDVYQKEIDVNGYLKSLTIQYSTMSCEVLTVQLSIAVGSMGKVN